MRARQIAVTPNVDQSIDMRRMTLFDVAPSTEYLVQVKITFLKNAKSLLGVFTTTRRVLRW